LDSSNGTGGAAAAGESADLFSQGIKCIWNIAQSSQALVAEEAMRVIVGNYRTDVLVARIFDALQSQDGTTAVAATTATGGGTGNGNTLHRLLQLLQQLIRDFNARVLVNQARYKNRAHLQSLEPSDGSVSLAMDKLGLGSAAKDDVDDNLSLVPHHICTSGILLSVEVSLRKMTDLSYDLQCKSVTVSIWEHSTVGYLKFLVFEALGKLVPVLFKATDSLEPTVLSKQSIELFIPQTGRVPSKGGKMWRRGANMNYSLNDRCLLEEWMTLADIDVDNWSTLNVTWTTPEIKFERQKLLLARKYAYLTTCSENNGSTRSDDGAAAIGTSTPGASPSVGEDVGAGDGLCAADAPPSTSKHPGLLIAHNSQYFYALFRLLASQNYLVQNIAWSIVCQIPPSAAVLSFCAHPEKMDWGNLTSKDAESGGAGTGEGGVVADGKGTLSVSRIIEMVGQLFVYTPREGQAEEGGADNGDGGGTSLQFDPTQLQGLLSPVSSSFDYRPVYILQVIVHLLCANGDWLWRLNMLARIGGGAASTVDTAHLNTLNLGDQDSGEAAVAIAGGVGLEAASVGDGDAGMTTGECSKEHAWSRGLDSQAFDWGKRWMAVFMTAGGLKMVVKDICAVVGCDDLHGAGVGGSGGALAKEDFMSVLVNPTKARLTTGLKLVRLFLEPTWLSNTDSLREGASHDERQAHVHREIREAMRERRAELLAKQKGISPFFQVALPFRPCVLSSFKPPQAFHPSSLPSSLPSVQPSNPPSNLLFLPPLSFPSVTFLPTFQLFRRCVRHQRRHFRGPSASARMGRVLLGRHPADHFQGLVLLDAGRGR
jgi:hypothetical protein